MLKLVLRNDSFLASRVTACLETVDSETTYRFTETINFGDSPFPEPGIHMLSTTDTDRYKNHTLETYAVLDLYRDGDEKLYVSGEDFRKIIDDGTAYNNGMVVTANDYYPVTSSSIPKAKFNVAGGALLRLERTRCDGHKTIESVNVEKVGQCSLPKMAFTGVDGSLHFISTTYHWSISLIKTFVNEICCRGFPLGGTVSTGFVCWVRNTFYSAKPIPGWQRFELNFNGHRVAIWCDPNFGNGAWIRPIYTDDREIYAMVITQDGVALGRTEIEERSWRYDSGLAWDKEDLIVYKSDSENS